MLPSHLPGQYSRTSSPNPYPHTQRNRLLRPNLTKKQKKKNYFWNLIRKKPLSHSWRGSKRLGYKTYLTVLSDQKPNLVLHSRQAVSCQWDHDTRVLAVLVRSLISWVLSVCPALSMLSTPHSHAHFSRSYKPGVLCFKARKYLAQYMQLGRSRPEIWPQALNSGPCACNHVPALCLTWGTGTRKQTLPILHKPPTCWRPFLDLRVLFCKAQTYLDTVS